MKLIVGLLLLACAAFTLAFPTGAPDTTCINLTPGHGGTPQPPPSPYSLDLSAFAVPNMTRLYFEPGVTYTSERRVQKLASAYTLHNFTLRSLLFAGTNFSRVGYSYFEPPNNSMLCLVLIGAAVNYNHL